MSRNLRLLSGTLIFAITALTVLIARGTATNLLAASVSPTGTYWNLNAGFGDSELELFDNGRYTNGGIGGVSVEGTYTVKGDQIVFFDFGQADAPCLHIPGTYRWAYDRQVLTLQAIDDQCPTRLLDWKSGEWVRHR